MLHRELWRWFVAACHLYDFTGMDDDGLNDDTYKMTAVNAYDNVVAIYVDLRRRKITDVTVRPFLSGTMTSFFNDGVSETTEANIHAIMRQLSRSRTR